MQYSVRYTLLFAAALCLACSLLVSSVAVSLHERTEANRQLLGYGRHLLAVAGIIEPRATLSAAEVAERMFTELEPRVVDLRTGAYVTGIDARAYDQRRAVSDPETSRPAPENAAEISRLPEYGKIFVRTRDGAVDAIVLPIEGMGLWSKMYGYIALESDARTIRGITFYEHSETPGLGAEIENPDWRARWEGRLAFDDQWRPKIAVQKGSAGTLAEDPYHVDGITGSTITCDGVTHLVQFWLGEHGFGPFLENYRKERGIG